MSKLKAFLGWLLCFVSLHDWYYHERYNQGFYDCWGGITHDRICLRCDKEKLAASKLIAARKGKAAADKALQSERSAKAEAALDKIQASKNKHQGEET